MLDTQNIPKVLNHMIINSSFTPSSSAVHITKVFIIAIQIQLKFCFAIPSIPTKGSLQIFVHDTTAHLSCHAQNFVARRSFHGIWNVSKISHWNGFQVLYINSSPPSASYTHQWIGLALLQIMASCLFGTKPLSEPMLGYHQLDP